MGAKPKFTRKTILLSIVGLAAFFLYILLFNVDLPKIIATARSADPLLYSAAVLVSFAEMFFYAVSWRSILKFLKVKISVIRSYLFVWYGAFIDIVIPAESVSGEVCRVYLVNREQEGTSGKVVASVVTQRILGMAMNIAALIIGIALIFAERQVNPIIFNLIFFFTAAIAIILVLLLTLSVKPTWSLKTITSLINAGIFLTRGRWRQKLEFLKEEAVKAAGMFHTSMKEFVHKPQALVVPTILVALNWLCSLSIPYLVFLSLGVDVSWSVILITGAIVVAVKSVPVGVPFEVGLPEITMTTLYTSLLGIQFAPVCATATILSRIITLWLRFGIGFASQQWIELKPVLKNGNDSAGKPKSSSVP
ncbi:MAG: flippase-like domain-containing protein [Candidatus Bathyarchaeota archaeon]|nr:flippase-like domain-containing protein [Candidatus Bathyarchaeota archaeon]